MGYSRLALALVIMAGHALAIPIIWAKISVWIFYGLAGYTGTASRPHYKTSLAYLASRYARIWPSYGVVFGVTSLALLFGWVAIPYPRLPDLSGWLRQLLLLEIPGSATAALHPWVVPVSWALPVMLCWWGVIALGWGQRRSHVLAWVAFGVAVMSLRPSYYSVWFAALPFALGAMAYHYGIRVPRDSRWGAVSGELSYPWYLVHLVILQVLPLAGWPLFFASLPPTLALSWILVIAVERPISRYRQRLKSPTP